MALEHRDYYREKKPDWDNISSRKKSRFLTPLLFLFFFVLTVAIFHWRDASRRSLYSPLVSVSVQSVPRYRVEQSVVSPIDKLWSLPNEIKQESFLKESPVVRSISGGYQGYMEVNGVKKEIWSEEIKTQTIKYRNWSNTKAIEVEVNGVPFEFQIDTGASDVALNTTAIRSLGITKFVERKMYQTANGLSAGFTFYATVKLGAFEVQNVLCHYSPNGFHNLLGGSFLKNFNYSFNESENTITLSLR